MSRPLLNLMIRELSKKLIKYADLQQVSDSTRASGDTTVGTFWPRSRDGDATRIWPAGVARIGKIRPS